MPVTGTLELDPEGERLERGQEIASLHSIINLIAASTVLKAIGGQN